MSFDQLPPELLLAIINQLSPDALVSFACVNSTCHVLSRTRLLTHRELFKSYKCISNCPPYCCRDVLPISPLLHNLLSDPGLAYYVQHICLFGGAAVTLPSTLVSHRLCNPALDAVLSSAHLEAEIDAGNEVDISVADPACLTAALLPLFPNLRRWNLRVDGSHLAPIASHVLRYVRELGCLYQQCPGAFASLNTIELGRPFNIPNRPLPMHDVLPFLGLPNLSSLTVRRLHGLGLREFCPEQPPVSILDQVAASMPTRAAPVQELRLETAMVSDAAFSDFISLIQKDTLRYFHLDLFFSHRASPWPTLDPRQYVKALEAAARNSLESFNFFVDNEMLYEHTYLRHSCEIGLCQDGHHRVAPYGFDVALSLASFTKLKDVTVDAEVLMNGYGMLGRARKAARRMRELRRMGYEQREKKNKDEETLWIEPPSALAPPLEALLPSSLETLRVGVTRSQRGAAIEMLQRLLVDLSASGHPKKFPALREAIMLFAGREEMVWKSAKSVPAQRQPTNQGSFISFNRFILDRTLATAHARGYVGPQT